MGGGVPGRAGGSLGAGLCCLGEAVWGGEVRQQDSMSVAVAGGAPTTAGGSEALTQQGGAVTPPHRADASRGLTGRWCPWWWH